MKPHYLFVIPALLFLSACGDDKGDDYVAPQASAEVLYNEARALMAEREYTLAAEAFDEVERQHPDSKWAVHAQVMSGYASYRASRNEDAQATLERFVKLYPAHESTPYAYYLIALTYYNQISDVGRDQKMTQNALQALREVIRRFPDSEYARDAKIKADLTIDHLAGKEMEVGRYYMKRDDYLAAINRFRYVIDNFQTTTHTPEALHRLVECYLKLGVLKEAKHYAAVLGHNFPESRWYRDSYQFMTGDDDLPEPDDEDDSWLDSVTPW